MLAEIIQLRPIEQDSFFIGNNIIVPSSDILCVVQAPSKIFRKVDHSTLRPLSATVSLISECIFNILNINRNTAVLQLHII